MNKVIESSKDEAKDEKSAQIQSIPLDEFIVENDINRVNLIKIDVEGF